MTERNLSGLPRLPIRKDDAHKGDFGRILVIGGSRGMLGAPALTANAALKSGAGLVTMAVPGCIQTASASLACCATSMALPYDDQTGCTSEDAIGVLLRAVVKERRFDVAAVGPGLGRASFIVHLIPELIEAKVPIVVDADALNNLSSTKWHGVLKSRCVITPHPGEMSRLLEQPIERIQAGRETAARRAVELMTGGDFGSDAVCLLKGHDTIITDGVRSCVNATGNPGMACGGTGDVLTGVIAALIGQGLGCYDAAMLGAYVHGLAGDIAAERFGQVSMTAEDLLGSLAAAFKELGCG